MSFLALPSSSMSTSFLSTVTLAPTREETGARLQLEKIEEAFSDFVDIFPKEIRGLISEYYVNEWMLRWDPVTFKKGSVSFLTACRANKYMTPYLTGSTETDTVQESLRLMAAVREEARYFEMPADESDTPDLAIAIDQERIILRYVQEDRMIVVDPNLLNPKTRPKENNHSLSLLPRKVTILTDTLNSDISLLLHISSLAECTKIRTYHHPSFTTFSHVIRKMKKLTELDISCSPSAAHSMFPFLHNFTGLQSLIVNTDPIVLLVPEQLKQYKKQNPMCEIEWNGTKVELEVKPEEASSSCVIA